MLAAAIASIEKALSFERRLTSRAEQMAMHEELLTARVLLTTLRGATGSGDDERQQHEAISVALRAVATRCEQSRTALRDVPPPSTGSGRSAAVRASATSDRVRVSC